jgi:hypothetical protein
MKNKTRKIIFWIIFFVSVLLVYATAPQLTWESRIIVFLGLHWGYSNLYSFFLKEDMYLSRAIISADNKSLRVGALLLGVLVIVASLNVAYGFIHEWSIR